MRGTSTSLDPQRDHRRKLRVKYLQLDWGVLRIHQDYCQIRFQTTSEFPSKGSQPEDSVLVNETHSDQGMNPARVVPQLTRLCKET